MDSLVFVGKIVDLQPIDGADFIVSATVVCGPGGKWRGIVRKNQFNLDDLCIVYLPDSLIPETEGMEFMAASNWRVKMRKFKGAPSEVLIMPYIECIFGIGCDVTRQYRVTKYHKPIPAHLNGLACGYFPPFIPKTDELNYQRHGDLVDNLVGKPYYITVKMDGSSTTAYRYNGVFGVCSRNLQLLRDEDNGYWKVAIKYKLEDLLPECIAIQWETCGPGIQSNPSGLDEIEGFVFSAYDINKQAYLEAYDLIDLCTELKMPMCEIVTWGQSFSKEGVEVLGEGKYKNGKQREGVVVRSQHNVKTAPISFKVINLGYET